MCSIAVAFLGAVITVAAAACGSTSTATPLTVASAIPSPTENLPAPSATPAGPVAVDPSLLAILPSAVAGLEVTESPEAENAALAGPDLAAVGTAMAAGIAVDTTSGEFVYAVVVRLKPGVMTDAVFRDWRDSYDAGACSQADGVTGHAQADLDGRTVFIGTCGGGLRTYHVWLADSGIVISASAVGEGRLGEQLMNGLRP